MMQVDSGKKVLVVSHDVAGKNMAGPGIRYAAIVDELSQHFNVTLGLLNGTQEQRQYLTDTYDFQVETFTEDSYEKLLDSTEYIFGQWLSIDMLAYARSRRKRVIFDLYSPVPIEFLLFRHFSSTGFSKLEQQEVRDTVERYKQYATAGDYFVCSNERQRDMWTGFFLAANILQARPEVCTDIESLIGVAPMGIPDTPPEHTRTVLRGVINGLKKDDFILLWTGGLWEWFDPLTVVKAVEKLHQQDARVKLVFMGHVHPNKNVPEMSEAKKTLDYVKKRGLEGTCVFFVDKWIPYEERVNYLLEGDAAIYAHKQSLETRYSHRSRVLDHIYAGLPTIATSGDFLSDHVIPDKDLGVVVENTVSDVGNAIQKLTTSPDLQARIRDSIEKTRSEFTWKETTRNLVEFIQASQPRSPINPSVISDRDSHPKPRYYIRRVIRKLKRYVT